MGVESGPSLLFFCRLATGLTFALSTAGKARAPRSFAQTIEGFRLVPQSLAQPLAYLFLTAEGTVAAAMLLGWLRGGFLLASGLLAVFSLALLSVLIRGLRVPCYCFGSGARVASPYDLVRNAGFLALAVLGWLYAPEAGAGPGWREGLLLALMAAGVVLLGAYMGDFLRALRA